MSTGKAGGGAADGCLDLVGPAGWFGEPGYPDIMIRQTKVSGKGKQMPPSAWSPTRLRGAGDGDGVGAVFVALGGEGEDLEGGGAAGDAETEAARPGVGVGADAEFA